MQKSELSVHLPNGTGQNMCDGQPWVQPTQAEWREATDVSTCPKCRSAEAFARAEAAAQSVLSAWSAGVGVNVGYVHLTAGGWGSTLCSLTDVRDGKDMLCPACREKAGWGEQLQDIKMCTVQEAADMASRAAAAEKARADRLLAAIKQHHDQKADDRCWMDDAALYEAAGFAVSDPQIGSKFAMLKNCARFIDVRCTAGGWPSYVELEQKIKTLESELLESELRESRRQLAGTKR